MTDSSQVVTLLTQVKHVSASRAKRFAEELNIQTIDELIKAAEADQLTSISGVGQKTQSAILDAAQSLLADLARPAEVVTETLSEDKAPVEVDTSSEQAVEVVEAPVETVETPEEATTPEVVATLDASAPKEASLEEPEAPVDAQDVLQAMLICPNCGHESFDARYSSVVCRACRREYTQHLGAVDLAPPYRTKHNLTQRLMETNFYAKYYEGMMRPRLTRAVTKRTLDEEYVLATKYLSFTPGMRLLDVACGTGNFTRYFAKTARAMGLDDAYIVGADLSMSMLENAHQYIKQENLEQTIALMRADASRLPLQPGSFTHLHCAAALHFMDDPDEVLHQFARVLVPDGIFVLSTFIKGKGLLKRGMKKLVKIPTSFGWFEVNDLHQRLNQAGFEVIAESIEGDAITLKTRRI